MGVTQKSAFISCVFVLFFFSSFVSNINKNRIVPPPSGFKEGELLDEKRIARDPTLKIRHLRVVG